MTRGSCSKSQSMNEGWRVWVGVLFTPWWLVRVSNPLAPFLAIELRIIHNPEIFQAVQNIGSGFPMVTTCLVSILPQMPPLFPHVNRLLDLMTPPSPRPAPIFLLFCPMGDT